MRSGSFKVVTSCDQMCSYYRKRKGEVYLLYHHGLSSEFWPAIGMSSQLLEFVALKGRAYTTFIEIETPAFQAWLRLQGYPMGPLQDELHTSERKRTRGKAYANTW
jgi:hypothetical protein